MNVLRPLTICRGSRQCSCPLHNLGICHLRGFGKFRCTRCQSGKTFGCHLLAGSPTCFPVLSDTSLTRTVALCSRAESTGDWRDSLRSLFLDFSSSSCDADPPCRGHAAVCPYKKDGGIHRLTEYSRIYLGSVDSEGIRARSKKRHAKL